MEVFEVFNQNGKGVCPICKTNKEEFTILVPVDGTQEVLQIHLQCLDLHVTLNTGEKSNNWIYQTFKTGETE